MKFDLFYQLPRIAAGNDASRYRELIEEVVEAERLGFHGVWLAEAHFFPRFSLLPAPMMLLAAIAERTSRIRLGLAVNLIPLHHPVRLAEESAMLDLLSGGRLEFGAGRGAFASNYHGYEIPMETSRERLKEALDFIRRAWLEPRLSFHGQFFNVDDIEVVPKPLQRPHPPIRLAANTQDTFEFAGANGFPIFAGGPVNPIPILGYRLDVYKQALAAAGLKRPEDWLAALLMVFAGRDRESVRAILEKSLRSYFDVISQSITNDPLSTRPAEEAETVRERLRTMKYETVDDSMGAFGDPAYCVDKIARLREVFDMTRLVCWFEIGGLSGHREVIESMRLFAEKVMPRFVAV
ncbi:MAG TPA: LLM class flavin-dependent oxidoreductase [Candidatus Binataceae bacterium]|nr:LLM class flavin-dependent oxidoreductase [Candidatus Binataceae bacterium]